LAHLPISTGTIASKDLSGNQEEEEEEGNQVGVPYLNLRANSIAMYTSILRSTF
jgi:hypothetical protein